MINGVEVQLILMRRCSCISTIASGVASVLEHVGLRIDHVTAYSAFFKVIFRIKYQVIIMRDLSHVAALTGGVAVAFRFMSAYADDITADSTL
jgi:hypothetical protein